MSRPESNLPSARSPLRALTGLRFVAAFWVVLFHFFRPLKLGIPMPASIDSILESGFCGIGLFFALSGFVLSYVYGDIDPSDPIAKRNFWAARFARVYPIHIVGFVLATPFVILHRMAKSSGLALLAKIVTAAAASLTLTQAWFWPLSRTWNGLSWTLSVEVFCYLLFPWIAAKLRTLREAELIALAGLMWICAMLPPAVWHFVPSLPEFFVLDDPLFHLPTFIAGAAAGFLFLRRKLSGARASVCAASGLAIILAVTAFSKSIAPGFVHNGFLIPGFCLLIYGLACDGWPASMLSGRVMQLLGDASYSVYILQFCVWWFSFAVVAGFARIDYAAATNTDVMAGSGWFFVVNSAILIALSILLFKYVETPARTYLRSRLSYHRPEAPSYVPDSLRRADA
jgi:peptidoglycan/LPS O-acetylase OafA/YrhL